jgi:hypothetical protein
MYAGSVVVVVDVLSLCFESVGRFPSSLLQPASAMSATTTTTTKDRRTTTEFSEGHLRFWTRAGTVATVNIGGLEGVFMAKRERS